MLKEKVLCGEPNQMTLDTAIDVYEENSGKEEYLTSLESDNLEIMFNDFVVRPLSENQISISLKKPPKVMQDLKRKLSVNDENKFNALKKVAKGPQYSYHPHSYPSIVTRRSNPLLNPHTISEKKFTRLVGMSLKCFYQLVQKLVSAGLKAQKVMSVVSAVTLFCLKLRQNWDFSQLSMAFGSISTRTVHNIFYKVLFIHFECSLTIQRRWTNRNLTEDQKDEMFLQMLPKEDLFMDLVSNIKDPTGQNRRPFPLCIDREVVTKNR